MTSFFRKFTWWMQRRRKEDELREELEFHLAEEADERQADGLTEDQARWAARRDLGNVTLLREDTRTLWTWTLLEQLAQDLRYALRTMFRNRAFTALAALSLALGIGANTAIYSFMDAILLRSLPVSDPGVAGGGEMAQQTDQRARLRHAFRATAAPIATVRASQRPSSRSRPLSACERRRHRSSPASSPTSRQGA